MKSAKVAMRGAERKSYRGIGKSNLLTSFFAQALLLACIGAGMAWGQSSLTSIRGTVTDPSGGSIPGASATLEEPSSKLSRTTTTNAQGEYQFLAVPPGIYTLTVTGSGFARYEQSAIPLLVDTPATVNVTLKVGDASQSISVTSEAAQLNTVDASVGNTFNETQVEQIPLDARNVPDLLSLQPGVTYTGDRSDINKDTDTRSGSVNGARSDQSNITLDGVDVNDLARGYAFTSVLPVTLDSVQEFRVSTTNYDADSGRGSGAQITMVTKSGSNQIHGSAYEFIRNNYTSANDYFIKLSEDNSHNPNVPNKLNRNVFGTSLGGPIRRNKLFMFGNYEGLRDAEQQSAVVTVPTATMRAGEVLYPNVNGGTTTLTAAQLTALDPQHKGPDPAVLNYLSSFPLPNINSVGDGLNTSGFEWRAPVSNKNNEFISRIDYHLSDKHTFFWRGNLQNLVNNGIPFLPGQVPEQSVSDHSKGMALGYTYIVTPSLVNTFRYGLTRQSVGNQGNSNQTWIQLSAISQSNTYSSAFQVLVHNFVDDVSWVKGKHTMQFGVNMGIIRDPQASTLRSYDSASMSLGNASPSSLANSSSPMDPTNGGFPEVSAKFNNTYNLPVMTLLGAVVTDTANYNYTKLGTALPTGAPVDRDYGMNFYEFYAQDSWKVRRNLTVNYGLRYSLFPAPYEINGVQVTPNVNLGNLFNENVQNMKNGIGYNADPLVRFVLGGPANNGPGLYNTEKTDFAPRASVAWSLRPTNRFLKKVFGDEDKTVIRGGYSKVYDRDGLQLIQAFNSTGEFGLATTLTNPCCIDGIGQFPRLTSMNALPTADVNGNTFLEPAPPGGFPSTPASGAAAGGTAQGFGINQNLKTPYAHTLDAAVDRQLGAGFMLELAYVGRIAGHQLAREDMMPMLDITDPKIGVDYFTAATRLTQLLSAGTPTSAITNALVGSTAAYWQDMFQPLKAGGAYKLPCTKGSTVNVVQAVYDEFSCFPEVQVLALGTLDSLTGLSDANLPNTTYYFNGGQNSFQNSQYASLFAFNSVGSANYNAGQATLKKRLSHGVQFDINYTFSKSLDIYSNALRASGSTGTSTSVVNSFAPSQLKGVSDFDLTHQFNMNYIVLLPFGSGRKFFGHANRALDAVVGGWQLAGLARWTSGFPISVTPGSSWPTNWSVAGLAEAVAIPQMSKVKNANGTVNMFASASTALGDFTYALPGQSGSRNVIRGDGYAGWDSSLSKRWKMPFEGHSLQLRWEVFNIPNLTRFNVQASTRSIQSASSFGNYSGLLTNPRVMQFGLRYDF